MFNPKLAIRSSALVVAGLFGLSASVAMANPPFGVPVDGKEITNRAGLTIVGDSQDADLKGKTVVLTRGKITVVSSNSPAQRKTGVAVTEKEQETWRKEMAKYNSTASSATSGVKEKAGAIKTPSLTK